MATFVRTRVVAAAGMLSMLVSAGCAGGPGTTTPAAAKLTLSACAVGSVTRARCGSLSVPENPAKPAGRHIPIRVVVVPAYGPDPAPDPLFVFWGGPGGAAGDPANVEWAVRTFPTLNGRHPLVFVDQRGTGGSNRMECPALMSLGGNLSGTPPTAGQAAAAARACLTSSASSGDPAMYTTPLFADDVDAVRAALGYTSIDIYGVSYGVSSGLEYIQRHAERVRTALFDSGSLLDVRLWQRGAAQMQASLQSVLDRCAADPQCAAGNPHLSDELAEVIARLTTAPVTVQAPDPTGKTVTATIDASGFAAYLSGFLDNVQDMAAIPSLVFTADLGDWALLLQQALASAPTDNPQVTYVMARTIECSDAWAKMDPAEIQASGGSSMFTANQVVWATVQNEFCAAWPSASGASGPVSTGAPVVFLNGTADESDPPANVAGAATTMPNSLVVPVLGYGHGQLAQDTSGCLAREAIAFIEAGVPSSAALWPCAANPPYPPFSRG
jgi:pimeloyl-ACP methyl ester carboxylesterase